MTVRDLAVPVIQLRLVSVSPVMEPDQLAEQFADQRFANGYQLIDGVQMNAENGDRFHRKW